MTLTQFLSVLDNGNAVITVLESDGTELVKLYAPGYEQLITELLARDIAMIKVVGPTAITVKLVGEYSG